MIYSKWLINWLDKKKERVKIKTYFIYKDIINNYVIPTLGKYKVGKINSNIINCSLSQIQISKKISPTYLNTIRTIIKGSLNDYYIGKYKPNFNIQTAKIDKNKKGAFDVESQKRLIEYIQSSKKLNFYGIIICLLTGIRLGELLALEWDDVNLSNKVIHINKNLYYGKDYDNKYKEIIYKPKTISSIRSVPLTSSLVTLLKEMKKESKTKYVIESKGKRQNLRSYQKKFKLILSKLNIKNMSFHSLRHTFATNSIEANVEIKTLSEILGHSSIKTTLDIYVTISNDFKVKEINKLNTYINKKCSSNTLLGEPFHLII